MVVTVPLKLMSAREEPIDPMEYPHRSLKLMRYGGNCLRNEHPATAVLIKKAT